MENETTASKESARAQMMDATARFIKKLDTIPGWHEARVSSLVATMDLDGMLSKSTDEARPFQLPP
ncbi:hypothetical protein [Burkholderia ambifaria]|nr:hypothetical protein [Burkholderia ambifaria]